MKDESQQIIDACKEDPALIFTLIKDGNFEIVEELVLNNIVNVNLVDSIGNDIITRLLKAKNYESVLKLMKKRNWNVNHQNFLGDTFAHILALDDSVAAVKIVEQLTKKKNYLPNIKNNNNETALDRALNSKYLYTAFKILEDKRFNNIDIFSFKNLFNVTVKNSYYGKYTKINNLEIIVENLEKKNLDSIMTDLIKNISNNMEIIKREIMNNSITIIETIINNHLVQN